MKSFLNNIRKNSILALAGFVCVGILLVIFPHKISNIAGYIVGALGIGFGVTKTIDYFSKNGKKTPFSDLQSEYYLPLRVFI